MLTGTVLGSPLTGTKRFSLHSSHSYLSGVLLFIQALKIVERGQEWRCTLPESAFQPLSTRYFKGWHFRQSIVLAGKGVDTLGICALPSVLLSTSRLAIWKLPCSGCHQNWPEKVQVGVNTHFKGIQTASVLLLLTALSLTELWKCIYLVKGIYLFTIFL